MMKIAICDNLSLYVERLHAFINDYNFEEKINVIADGMFIYQYKGKTIRVPYGNIKYLYSNWWKVMIVCKDDTEVVIRANLNNIWKKNFSILKNYARANKNYIINLSYVERFFGEEVLLDDKMIAISARYLNDFRKRSTTFLFGESEL